jgi:hypothetical protein
VTRKHVEIEQPVPPTEAARVLQLTPKTLANWRVMGRGPEYVKLGDGGGASGRGVRVGYLPSVLHAYIESHRRTCTTQATE